MAQLLEPALLRGPAPSPSGAMLDRLTQGSRPSRRHAAGPAHESDRVDFSLPGNPYFPSPEMLAQLQGVMQNALRQRPADTDTVAAELCDLLDLNPQTVVVGNGTTELVTWIDHLLVRESLAVPIPASGHWIDQPLENGRRVDMFPLREDDDFALDLQEYVRFIRRRGSRAAVVCNPNNPDGGYLPRRQLLWLLDELADLDLVVIDESFVDFVDAERSPSVAEEAAIRPNVAVLRSLGQNLGLPGARFGYLVAGPALANTLRKAMPKRNLNPFAEHVVALLREYGDQYRQSLALLARDRSNMSLALAAVPGLVVFASQGNFVFVKLPDRANGVRLREYLLSEHGVLVRECGDKLGSSSRFLRLAVRPGPDVERLLTGLQTYLGTGTRPPSYLPFGAPAPGSGPFG